MGDEPKYLEGLSVILDVSVSKSAARRMKELGCSIAAHAQISEPDCEWWSRGFENGGTVVVTNDVEVIIWTKRAGLAYLTLPVRVSREDLNEWVVNRLIEYVGSPDRRGYIKHLNTVTKGQRKSASRDPDKPRTKFESIAAEMKRAGYVS